MGTNTKIEWCHHTFNPWEGCEKVSPGCANCYAWQRDKQYHAGSHWGPGSTRKIMSESNWKKPVKWNIYRYQCSLCGHWNHPVSEICQKQECTGRADDFVVIERPRVFPSLCDPFEDREELQSLRHRLFKMIIATPNLDWLLLTKRPENLRKFLPISWQDNPQPNVWIGTSVENQEYADKRIPELLKVPARVRFLSLEPLLGPIEFSDLTKRSDAVSQLGKKALNGIHWVIVGGESGSSRRKCELSAITSIVEQCTLAGVPVFVKQDSALMPGQQGQIPDDIWARKEVPAFHIAPLPFSNYTQTITGGMQL